MKKDKEWLKEQIKDEEVDLKYAFDNYVPYEKVLIADDVNELLNQLEEPDEIELSEPSAWKTIAKLYHPNEVYWGNVRDSYIESLDKQEKVVVNEMMAAHIENCKNLKLTLSDSLNLVMLRDKQEEALFARAWLDGYTVEKEQLYYLKLPNNGYFGELTDEDYFERTIRKERAKKFTEQEIKAIDERYLAFKVEITK